MIVKRRGTPGAATGVTIELTIEEAIKLEKDLDNSYQGRDGLYGLAAMLLDELPFFYDSNQDAILWADGTKEDYNK